MGILSYFSGNKSQASAKNTPSSSAATDFQSSNTLKVSSASNSTSLFTSTPSTDTREYLEEIEGQLDSLIEDNLDLENIDSIESYLHKTDSKYSIKSTSPETSNNILDYIDYSPRVPKEVKEEVSIDFPTEEFELVDAPEVEEAAITRTKPSGPKPIPFRNIRKNRAQKRGQADLRDDKAKAKLTLTNTRIIDGFTGRKEEEMIHLLAIRNDLIKNIARYSNINSLVDSEDEYLKLYDDAGHKETVDESVLKDLNLTTSSPTSFLEQAVGVVAGDLKKIFNVLNKIKEAFNLIYTLAFEENDIRDKKKLISCLKEIGTDIVLIAPIINKYTKNNTVGNITPFINIFVSVAAIIEQVLHATGYCIAYTDLQDDFNKLLSKVRENPQLFSLINADESIQKDQLFDQAFKSSIVDTSSSDVHPETVDDELLEDFEIVDKLNYENASPVEKIARKFDMSIELKYINKKRALRSVVNILTELPPLVGKIAAITGVGTTVGYGIQGGAFVMNQAVPKYRLIKQKLRDTGWISPNGKTSTDKHFHRVSIIKELLYQIWSLEPESNTFVEDTESISTYLKGAGASPEVLYQADSPQVRIWYLYKKLRSRE